MRYLAHSGTQEHPEGQALKEHLENVSQLAASFIFHPLLKQLAGLSGLYHDAGKYKMAFQRYLKEESHEKTDHATLGGQLLSTALSQLPPAFVAAPIFGHHGGIPNGVAAVDRRTIVQRLSDELPQKAVEAFYAEMALPRQIELSAFPQLRFGSKETIRFEMFMAIHMIYSALVDADYLDTEKYFEPAQAAHRGNRPTLEALLPRYEGYMSKLKPNGSKAIGQIRSDIREQCLKAAHKPQGLFSLTVPTGGGKTLSSLGFALNHAKTHPHLKRIIYAIPFTSIIEQNAQVFREALGEQAVLEHHSATTAPEEGTAIDRASENWDAPVVVTTNVQLFESLFSNKPSKCRKLHNLQDSIIILDEMQALPDRVLRPCLAALQSLVLNYRATVVICTATQPNYENVWVGQPNVTEIIDDPEGLFEAMRRTKVVPLGELTDEALLDRLFTHEQVLCIVNSRKQAQALHKALGGEKEGAYHLSTLMCPEHRSEKLALIRARLDGGKRVRVISTSLIEAGVDVDFPVVYRALAGLDAIAQACGRCNRGGHNQEPMPVYVFQTTKWSAPAETVDLGKKTLKEVAPNHKDWLSREALNSYFQLRFGAGKNLDEHDILLTLAQTKGSDFSHENIGMLKLIDDASEALYIPYDEKAKALLKSLETAEQMGSILRQLQRYSISIYAQQKQQLIEKGYLRQIQGALVLDAAQEQMALLYSDEYGLDMDGKMALLNY